MSDIKISNINVLYTLINLQDLYLNKTHVSNINPLFGLMSLKTLYIQQTQVPIEELCRLRENLPQIKIYD